MDRETTNSAERTLKGNDMQSCYVKRRFGAKSLKILEHAVATIEEYEGHITLRQLYYRLVAAQVLENKPAEGPRLAKLLSRGRLAGIVDWDPALCEHDRPRLLRPATWKSPGEILGAMAEQYREDLWRDQLAYCEVWIEKAAVLGTVRSTCDKLRVPCMACPGHVSQSEMHNAGYRRLHPRIEAGKRVYIFHFGDHTPTGLDISRDLVERLEAFAGGSVSVVRLALNHPQVEHYKLPPNPALFRDSRLAEYLRDYGNHTWELEALAPEFLHTLIENAVHSIRDESVWESSLARERSNGAELHAIAREYRNDIKQEKWEKALEREQALEEEHRNV